MLTTTDNKQSQQLCVCYKHPINGLVSPFGKAFHYILELCITDYFNGIQSTVNFDQLSPHAFFGTTLWSWSYTFGSFSSSDNIQRHL